MQKTDKKRRFSKNLLKNRMIYDIFKKKIFMRMINMGLTSVLLLAAALIPGIVLLSYVYKKDRAEKEPVGLLLLLLALGALSCLPASLLEGILIDNVLYNIFAPFGSVQGSGIYLSDGAYNVYLILENFIGVALVEEGLKWIILYFVTRRNKNFNSLFDGLIYAVFVSLGFALLENVLYVFNYGFETAVLRAVTAVPGHMFDGVIMGYFYTLWRSSFLAHSLETYFMSKEKITVRMGEFKPKRLLALSLVMPVLAHGFYDYCCSKDAWWSTAVFYIFLIALYVYCFSKIRELSKLDMPGTHYSVFWFTKTYPYLKEDVMEMLGSRNNSSENSSAYN